MESLVLELVIVTKNSVMMLTETTTTLVVTPVLSMHQVV